MTRRKMTRIYRRATPEERARDAEIRRQVEAEKPELEAGARESVDRYESTLVRYLQIQGAFDLAAAVAELRSARQRKGLTLAEVSNLTGVAESELSDLETGDDESPTLRALQRYAQTVGLRIALELSEAECQTAKIGPAAKATEHREAG